MTRRDEAEAEVRAAMRAGEWGRAETLGERLDTLLAPRPVAVLAAALWYAQQGLKVFPIQPLTKVPLPWSRGCSEASSDPEVIRAWWATHPTANVAIATGHLIDVVDFDGPDAHAAWGREHGGWAEGGVEPLATVSTPRPGGLHVYIRATGQGNRAGLLPGVDFRGRGGYVLAPPSGLDDRPGQHPGTYRFLRPLHPEDL